MVNFVKEFLSLKKTNVAKTPAGAAHMWSGNYEKWEDAYKKCTGYEASNILDKVRNAILKVKKGEAPYERDSVIFDKKEYSWALLSCMQQIAIEQNSELKVLDFGGSLGTTYFQNIEFLKACRLLLWYIVEQENFVDCGKREFEDERLRFSHSISDVLQQSDINCLLLSGVLQCISNPYEMIRTFLKYDFPYIIVDRTAFIQGEQRLTVQQIPAFIYEASYPCWFFNEQEFLASFTEQYDLIADFESFADHPRAADDGKPLYWKGFFFKRKE